MWRIPVGRIAGTAIAVILAITARVQAYEAVAVSEGGAIAGTIKFIGTPPPARAIKVMKNAAQCGPEVPYEGLVVAADRGIKNAVVWITDIPKGKAWNGHGAIDQRKCHFQPHIAVAQAGAPVEVLNSDGILHNFHTYSSLNRRLNIAQPKFRPKMTEQFARPEIIKIMCDDHPWMRGWLVVSESPYVAVTDGQGNFRLADIPPGTYTVEIWHETLGRQVKTLAVKNRAETTLNAEFAPK